jgi:hypothetical protein
VQVRRSAGGDIADEERRTLATLRIGGVVKRWRNWHAANGASPARACGGGKNAVNQA